MPESQNDSDKELEKAWENYYEVQGYSPFATCGNDQCRSKDLCVLTSAAMPSTSPSSPLHAPFTPSTPGSQVPGVDSPCSPLHQVRGGVSPSRGNASKVEAMQAKWKKMSSAHFFPLKFWSAAHVFHTNLFLNHSGMHLIWIFLFRLPIHWW